MRGDQPSARPRAARGVPHRWRLMYSERRQPPAPRAGEQGLRKQSAQEGNAWKIIEVVRLDPLKEERIRILDQRSQ